LRQSNDREGRILQAAGTAYAALHRADLPAAHQQSEAMLRVEPPSELAARLVQSLQARVTQVADRVVTNCAAQAHAALQVHEPKQAVDILASANVAKDFSTPEIRQTWKSLKKQAARAKLLKRVGMFS